jgi:hypothetical protein
MVPRVDKDLLGGVVDGAPHALHRSLEPPPDRLSALIRRKDMTHLLGQTALDVLASESANGAHATLVSNRASGERHQIFGLDRSDDDGGLMELALSRIRHRDRERFRGQKQSESRGETIPETVPSPHGGRIPTSPSCRGMK